MPPVAPTVELAHPQNPVSAAITGHGLLLANNVLVADSLRHGKLVAMVVSTSTD